MKKNLNNLSSQVSDKTQADKFLILFSVFFQLNMPFFPNFLHNTHLCCVNVNVGWVWLDGTDNSIK